MRTHPGRMQITLESVKLKGQIRIRCSHPGCNKLVQRTKTFEQTLNPWNKDADGNVKSSTDIRRELIKEREAWVDKLNESGLLCPDHR